MSKGKKQAIYQLSQCLFSNHMLIEQQPTWIWNTYNNMILSVACTEINWLTRFKCRAHIYKTWTITMWTSKTTGSLTYISLMQLHEVNILNMTYIYMHKTSSLSYSTQCEYNYTQVQWTWKLNFLPYAAFMALLWMYATWTPCHHPLPMHWVQTVKFQGQTATESRACNY